jgi:hypothetical protein
VIGLLHVEYMAGRMPRRTVFMPSQIKSGAFCDICIRLPVCGSQKTHRRMVHRAARKMVSYGIRRVVPPQEPFPYWEILLQYDIQPVSVKPLLWRLATPIALFYLSSTGRARRREVVVLQAERMQVEIVRVAEQLCQKVRNVAFQIPDCAALEDRLRVEYGMPVLAGGACFAQSGLVLLFSATPKGETVVPGRGALFYFGEGEPQLRTERCRLQTVALALKNGEALPDLWDQTSLLAALWEMGYVSLREMEIIQLS